jgi:hypothetical protein
MDLVLFMLPNGAEVIGKKIYTDADGISVSHPLVLQPQITEGSQQYTLRLFPHSLSNPEGTHYFHSAQILSRSDNIPAQLEKVYLERTSSIILSSALDQMERMG